MADRYWVGGTASWDATVGTKWAATSGGAGGQSVPGPSDNVFFDAASGAVTVTISATGNVSNLNFTGFTGTFAGGNSVNVGGSLTLSSSMTLTATSTFGMNASSGAISITTAGKTIPGQISIGSSGVSTATFSLQDPLIVAGALTVTAGTFTTNNFNITASALSSSNSNTRTINLGTSTVTLNTTGSAVSFTANTNLTFNAGTSTIICTANSSLVGGATSGQGVTFYNVSFTATTAGTYAINGINTFNNLTVAGPTSASVVQVAFDSRTTINGTLSTTGTTGNRRVWFRGATYGIAQTLTVNSTPSLTDADFRDIYVIGTAAPISGTRIGNLRGCSGITFSTPKTVYWSQVTGGNWSGTNWSSSAGGTPNDQYFPLAQDTATIVNTGLNSGATITWDSAILYTGTLDMSGRSITMGTLSTGASGPTFYGDLLFGTATGAIIGMNSAAVFSGRNTQTITTNGRSTAGSGGFNIDSYGGTVQLADALDIGSASLAVTNGTFNTQGYAVTAGSLSSSNSNVRAINLGASTLTLSSNGPLSLSTSTNLTFNAGTSQISCTRDGVPSTFSGSNLTFYNVAFTGVSAVTNVITATGTFNNLTLAAPSTAGLMQYTFSGNIVVSGTLTCAGATAVRRIFLRSDTLGTTRTLTVNSLSATDCDFRDITIAGAAAGSSPTRAGDCGGNTGITFPSPKTVYWNLAGSSDWGDTGWALSSGGSPNINNFPLAQDTAVFDNTGSVTGIIATDARWNIGTIDASARTLAMTLNAGSAAPFLYGNWSMGSGVTLGSGGTVTFSGRGTTTITNNGTTFNSALAVDCYTGTVQLADALILNSGRTLTLTSGTFDAVSYNVTTGLFDNNVATTRTLKMGSGTWTLLGTGAVWASATITNLAFYKGTANIVLSDTTTTTRAFQGGGLSYNKLTIGGATGTSTLTISQNNQFTELASTKTVAHTIALGTTTQTLGAWTVTGTAGNVVTVTGTGIISISGARVSGVDYLALGTTTVNDFSLGEFYAGANSTGTASNALFFTAAPAPRTLYWVGGTGSWTTSSTTNWSLTSGGSGGEAAPRSADAVVFDSASNATAYTVTCTAGATTLRCGSLTFAGPASGNVTWAGTGALTVHGNFTIPATGLTRSYTGTLFFSGSTTGKTITTNGISLDSTVVINGIGSGWTLGSAANIGSNTLTVTNGTFDTGNYSFSAQQISSSNSNTRTINLGSSTVTVTSAGIAITFTASTNLNFNAGTSSIIMSGTGPNIDGGSGVTFNNVSFTNTAGSTLELIGANTFNNLSFVGRTSAGVTLVDINANQTITGTLTLSAGTNATMRTFLLSDTIGTTRTLTCAAFSGTDVDFRDITIAGAAAPVSGTRLGDCKGNSGITFPAAKTAYRFGTSTSYAGSNSWSLTAGGAGSNDNFPLAQDTVVFIVSPSVFPSSGGTVTVDAAYNIGTIDMSARTSNTMTLATSTNTPAIYGNWINGTGTTLTGTGTMTFAGRGSQTITSAGRTFTQPIFSNNPGGTVTLADSFNTSLGLTVSSGTFNAVTYDVTCSTFSGSTNSTRTIGIGSGTWTITGSGANAWSTSTSTNLTVTGTGTISFTSATAKTFSNGGASYSGITINQGGAGTLTISNSIQTFKDITNSYSATGATAIAFGTNPVNVSQFTAAGTSAKLLTISGASPATLILTGATNPNVDYLTITGVRAYSLTDTWYAGANSTNNGSLGWIFSSGSIPTTGNGRFFFFF